MVDVLIVAAHPDDEVLGMGGTIATLAAAGHVVSALFLADGVSSRGEEEMASALERRRSSARAAARTLGTREPRFGNFPDNRLDTVALLDLVRAVEVVKAELRPEVVFTHHPGDLNIDHRRTAEAALTAFRPQPGECCQTLLAFPVPSSSEWNHPSAAAPFVSDTWIDITAHLESLMAACRCYGEELRPEPHARSLSAVRLAAEHRGRQVGVGAAETFATLRRVVRTPQDLFQ